MVKEKFFEYLETTSLSNESKISLSTIFENLEKKHPRYFTNRSFILEGEPGVGKTFLVKKMIELCDYPILFFGQSKITGKKVKRVKDFNDLIDNLNSFDNGIVYLDDVKYLFGFNEFDEMESREKNKFMQILENFRENDKNTILIMTLNNSDFLDNSFRDRIDLKIKFDFPSIKNKESFILDNFSEHVGREEAKYISENTIGYNYRDLPQLLKIAYYENNSVSLDSIKRAIEIYVPSSLLKSNIKQGIKTKINDLFINKQIKEKLMKFSLIFKNRAKLLELNVSKSNLVIFEGPTGCGKTFSAYALAGEMGVPLIKIDAKKFRSVGGLQQTFRDVERFQKSLILIDDFDKIINRSALELDDGDDFTSLVNSSLDNLNEGAIIVLSVNDSKRLGTALRGRFKIIKFENPADEERGNFFEKLINNSKIKFNITKEELSDITKNSNYRELQRVWNDLIFYAIENNIQEINKEHLAEVLPIKNGIASYFG